MTTLEPPTAPKLWDLWELQPWYDEHKERRILRDITGFELSGNVWFFTKVDRSVTAVPLGEGQIYQIRPA